MHTIIDIILMNYRSIRHAEHLAGVLSQIEFSLVTNPFEIALTFSRLAT